MLRLEPVLSLSKESICWLLPNTEQIITPLECRPAIAETRSTPRVLPTLREGASVGMAPFGRTSFVRMTETEDNEKLYQSFQ